MKREQHIPGIRPLRTIYEEPRKFPIPQSDDELNLLRKSHRLETIFDLDRIGPRIEFTRHGEFYSYTFSGRVLEHVTHEVNMRELNDEQRAFCVEHGCNSVLELQRWTAAGRKTRHRVWVPAIKSKAFTGWEGILHD